MPGYPALAQPEVVSAKTPHTVPRRSAAPLRMSPHQYQPAARRRKAEGLATEKASFQLAEFLVGENSNSFVG